MPGFTHPQMQDFAFLLVELHEILPGLILQSVEVSQSGNTRIWYKTPHSFVSSINLLKVHSVLEYRLLMKMLYSTGPRIKTSNLPPTEFCTTDNLLGLVHSVFDSPHCALT